jgi:hypothetical protein
MISTAPIALYKQTENGGLGEHVLIELFIGSIFRLSQFRISACVFWIALLRTASTLLTLAVATLLSSPAFLSAVCNTVFLTASALSISAFIVIHWPAL